MPVLPGVPGRIAPFVVGWFQVDPDGSVSDAEARATTPSPPDQPLLSDHLSLREHVEYISRLQWIGR